MSGGKQIQRHHALERFGAGQRRAVEQRQRIAITQSAHIDIAVADHAEAGDAAQCASDIAFAGAGDILARQHRDDLGRRAHHVAVALAGHDDRAAGNGNVWRCLFVSRRIGW